MTGARIAQICLALVVFGLSAIFTALVVSAGPNDQQVQVIQVDLAEWAINPKVVTVTAGVPVRFEMKNSGRFQHTLEVAGNGIDVRGQNVPGGQSGTWDYTFTKAGGYAIWCPVGNGRHLEQGMWGTLRVVDPQSRNVPFQPNPPAPLQAAAPAAPANVQTVNVDLEEWMIAPKTITVTAGVPVRFVMQNKGNFPHYLEIGGNDVNVASGNVISKTTGVWDYTFQKPGGYAIWCPVGGGSHLMRGMISTVYVVPPPGQGAPAQATQVTAQPAAAQPTPRPAAPAAAPAAQATARPAAPPAAPMTAQPVTQRPGLPRTGDLPIGLVLPAALGVLALGAGLALVRRRRE